LEKKLSCLLCEIIKMESWRFLNGGPREVKIRDRDHERLQAHPSLSL